MLLDSADIFRFPLTFILNKREKTSTKTGKIITFGIIIYLLLNFLTSDLLNKNNPKILFQDLTQTSHPEMYFSKANMTLVITISTENNSFLTDESVFALYFNKFQRNKTNQIEMISSFKMQLCTQNDFIENPKEFLSNNFYRSFCLPNETFKLNGFWDENSLDYAWIEMKICQNSTEENSVQCKSETEINTLLEDTYVSLHLSNHNIDAENYKTPISRSLKLYYQKLEVNFVKTVTLFLKKTEIETYDGFVFDSFSSIDSFVHAELLMDISKYKENEQNIHKICLFSSDMKTKVRRDYQKIQTLLAQLGGICNFLFLLGFMISKVENTYQLTSTLSNELFIFPSLNYCSSQKNSLVEPLKSSVFKQSPKSKKKDKPKKNLTDRDKFSFSRSKVSKKSHNLVSQFFQLGANVFPLNKRIASICGLKKQESSSNMTEKCPITFDFEKSPYENTENPNFSQQMNSRSRVDPRFGNLKIDLGNGEKHPWRERMMSFFKNKSEQNSPSLKKLNTPNEKAMVNIEHYQRLKQKENFFSIGFFGFIKLLFKNRRWWLNSKEKLFVKAENQIDEELDILQILQRLHDIDKLKRILLSEDQLYFFNLLSKPMIVPDSNRKNHRESSLECRDRRFKFSPKKNTVNTERMMKLYSGMLQRSVNCDVDKRIMKLLDEDVKCFLEHENKL